MWKKAGDNYEAYSEKCRTSVLAEMFTETSTGIYPNDHFLYCKNADLSTTEHANRYYTAYDVAPEQIEAMPDHIREKLFPERDNASLMEHVPAGEYSGVSGYTGEVIALHKLNFARTDLITKLDCYDPVIAQVESFLSKKHVYTELDILYKTGVLLYGPPGTSKSMCLRYILRNTIPKDAIIIHADHRFSRKFRDALALESERLKVIVFEELLNLAASPSALQFLLEFLDGNFSIANTLVLATTNHPEDLPGSLTDRPSRFDYILHMDKLAPADCERLVRAFKYEGPVTDANLQALSKLEASLIREIVLQSRLTGTTLMETKKRLTARRTKNKQIFKDGSDKGTRSFGFGISYDDYDDD